MDKKLLNEIISSVNLNDHINFTEVLLSRYDWGSNNKNELLHLLQIIKAKHNDRRLYMAVVGEFASGKSSFINAILRDDLLKTDILQATTTTSTLIESGETLEVVVTYNDGSVSTYTSSLSFWKRLWRKVFKPQLAKLKEEIGQYIASKTANEKNAVRISSVLIKHPSQSLNNGHVIIDTPGLNAQNERHEKVTAKAVMDISDAAIIIVPANAPLGASLLDFIKKNLEPVISKCIFIINKMDLIRMKEQPRIIEYVRQRLQKEFEIEEVTVLPYTPHCLLKDISNDIELLINQNDKQVLLSQSLETENQIFNFLRQQRFIAQMQKVILLLGNMFTMLDQNLRQLEKEYQITHKALIDNQITDLGTFVKIQKKNQTESLRSDFDNEHKSIVNQVDEIKRKLLGSIRNIIFNATSRGKLNKAIKKQLPIVVKQVQQRLDSQLPEMFLQFQPVADKRISKFEEEFKKLYEKLSTLGGQISFGQNVHAVQAYKAMGGKASKQLSSVKYIMNKESSNNAVKSLGGAGAGALAGTAVFPGIGTAIGAVVGAAASLFFRKPLNVLKQEYYDATEESLDSSFNALGVEIKKVIDEATQSSINELISIIDAYFMQYSELVKQMILRDENEKRILERKSIQIQKDLSELEYRRSSSESIREALKKL